SESQFVASTLPMTWGCAEAKSKGYSICTRHLPKIKGGMASHLYRQSMAKLAMERQINGEKKAELFSGDNVNLRTELSARYDFSRLIGNSNAMRAVYEQIAQVACSNTTVLITGES